MTKDIYLITNNANGKSYVGQSIDAEKRFQAHKRATEDVALHRAINKYGVDKFSLMILESQVEDYNDRERFWIDMLDTQLPNGYNMTPGGEDYPHYAGTEHYSSMLSDEQVAEIRKLLKSTNLKQEEIGKKFGVAQTVVSRINLGSSYFDEHIKYPIRCTISERIQDIRNAIINTKLSFNKIAKIFGVNKSTIMKINSGKIYFDKSFSYPLRINYKKGKLDNECALSEIKRLLEESELTTVEIGKLYGVERITIEHINQGKSYKHNNWDYPLRKRPRIKTALSNEEVNQIIKLLRESDMSFRAIGRQFNVMHNTIQGINNGTTKSYHRDDIDYPIRKRY